MSFLSSFFTSSSSEAASASAGSAAAAASVPALLSSILPALQSDAASCSETKKARAKLRTQKLSPRAEVAALLTIRPGAPSLAEPLIADIESMLLLERAAKTLVDPASLPRIASSGPLSRVSVWRGDITCLSCDAIVNAANGALLGCFTAGHRCIDNVIHAAAGPRLRDACVCLMQQQGHDEPVGQAKITPAFMLPSRFVIHTVGPQLDLDVQTRPDAQQQAGLISAYRSVLDAAEAHGSIASLAFCSISTGLFGYPLRDATIIAVTTVREWIDAHPQSTVRHVIFDVFSELDDKTYRQVCAESESQSASAAKGGKPKQSKQAAKAAAAAVAAANGSVTSSSSPAATSPSSSDSLPPHVQAALTVAERIVAATAIPASPSTPVPEGVSESDLQLAAGWLGSASSLLLCGAAGLSASAGLDYTSSSVCSALFPAMAQYDFQCFYEAIGKNDWSPELQWGYLWQQVFLARFNWPQSQLYQQLKDLAQTKQQSPQQSSAQSSCESSSPSPSLRPSFVLTSNADGMFVQNGFPADRVLTAQGDYGRMQCLTPCRPDAVWDSRPAVEDALPHIDPQTQTVPTAFVPRCPHCAGPAFLNVRGGGWFLEGHLREQQSRYQQFVSSALAAASADRPLVILELGAGFNTPGVIRLPMEKLAATQPHVRLIRVNAMHPEMHPKITAAKRGVGLAGDAAQVVNWLHAQTSSNAASTDR